LKVSKFIRRPSGEFAKCECRLSIGCDHPVVVGDSAPRKLICAFS
jgi:hypothetical protein